MSQALVLRFGADTTALRSSLSQLANEAPRALATLAQASIASSATLRNSLISAGADGTRTVSAQLVALARDTDNLRLVTSLAGEGIKTAFAINHPVLAIGLRLLSEYKVQLALVAAGALTLHEAVKIMGDQFDRINHIIDGSLQAGVSATLFQAWTTQAAQFGLSVKEAEEAIAHLGQLAKRELSGEQIGTLMKAADELQNGLGIVTRAYGDLREATTADDIHQAALTLVRDYLSAADALRAQGQEAKGMRLELEAGRLATEVWGQAAYKVVDAIKSGKVDIDGYVKAARDAGYVWGEDIVRAQKDSNEALRIAEERLANEMAPTMRGLAEDAVGFQNIWTKIVELIASAVGWVNRLSEKLGLTTKADLFTEEQFKDLPGMRNLAAENAGRESSAYRGPDPSSLPDAPRRPSQRALEFSGRLSEHAARGGSGSSKSESLDEVERYIQTLEKQNAALEGEAAAIGKSAVEREKSIDLAKAEQAAKERGTPLTEEERAKVLQLAEAHVVLRQKIDDANKAKQAANAQQKLFTDTAESSIEKLIVEHEKFADVLRDIVKELERAMLKGLLLGEGSLGNLLGGGAGKDGAPGGLLGSLIGGIGSLFKFADGGMVTLAHLPRYAGGGALAPDGGFPILAHPGEIILNMAQQRNVAEQIAGRRGGDGMSVTVVNNAGRQVKATPSLTAGELVLTIDSRVDRRLDSLKDNILDIIDDRQKRR